MLAIPTVKIRERQPKHPTTPSVPHSYFFVPPYVFNHTHTNNLNITKMKKRIKHLMPMLATALIMCSASSIIAQTLSVTLTPSNYNNFNISCFGAKDGSVTTIVTGGTPPYIYVWSNSDNSSNISNLAAGFYSVRVTDAANNAVDAEITLEEPENFKMETSLYTYPNGYNISLFNACNGSVTLTMINGIPPITYQWSD